MLYKSYIYIVDIVNTVDNPHTLRFILEAKSFCMVVKWGMLNITRYRPKATIDSKYFILMF